MTVLGRLIRSAQNPENPAVPLTSTALISMLDAAPGVSGVSVSEESAMKHIAVYRCVELIAGTCAALPLKAFQERTEGGRTVRARVASPVLDDPHPELTKFETWEVGFACLLLWGNAYFRKLRDGTGRVRYLWPLHPSRVDPELVNPTATNPGGKVFDIRAADGELVRYTPAEILHIPGLGYDGKKGLSRIQLAKQGIGTALAAERYAAKFFGSGQLLSGILKTDKSLTSESAAALKQRWNSKVAGINNAHDIAVLDNGAEFQPISIPPEDAQLLESQNWGVTQIARLFGLPPHAVGDVTKSSSWGTGIEQQTIGMVQFTLQPSYLTRVEQRLTKEVLSSPTVYAKHIVEGLLRGDSKARAEFYRTMVEIRAMNPNEVRGLEELPPYEGGDSFENPNITPGTTDTGDTDDNDD